MKLHKSYTRSNAIIWRLAFMKLTPGLNRLQNFGTGLPNFSLDKVGKRNKLGGSKFHQEKKPHNVSKICLSVCHIISPCSVFY